MKLIPSSISLFRSNDLVICTLPNDKPNSASKKNKPKQVAVKEACKEPSMETRTSADRQPAKPSKFSLESLWLIVNAFKSHFSIIGKEKFYALFYLFLFFSLCYLFAIICYNSL